MEGDAGLVFKIAEEEDEFEAIHRLNHRTFAEEIPQHAPNAERRLVDKFHEENTYAICFDGERLVGMVAGRANRPFSLDAKLPNLDSHLPAGRRPIEVRLLAVDDGYRKGFVFARLVGLIAKRFRDQGCDLALISGTTRQERLYRHLGFVAFGPVLGSGDACFQPMYLTLEKFLEVERSLEPPARAAPQTANFLPGPVAIHEDVRRAFERGPVSHRSAVFAADLRAVKRMVCDLTGARHVEVLLGSGSLANDVVCGQISLLASPGLVLANGEFGERLVDHATRFRLDFDVQRAEWGAAFDFDAVERRLAQRPELRWLWAVHCETSTGVLNDAARLAEICTRRDVKLCLDCVSSIGTVPVDLSAVHLASCASGKALGSYPGLSMVLHRQEVAPSPTVLPRYLDLGYWAAEDGIPFTQSSNLVYALQAALLRGDWPSRYARLAAASRRLRQTLEQDGFRIVADAAHASPAVVSIALPEGTDAGSVGRQLEERGFLLSCNSGYLRKRNWIQVCLMGEWDDANLDRLPQEIAAVCG